MTIPGTLTGVDTAFWLDQYWTSIFRALVQSPRINSPAFYIWMHLKQAALNKCFYILPHKLYNRYQKKNRIDFVSAF